MAAGAVEPEAGSVVGILRIGAHRGAMAYAPENTLAAFDKAIEFGTYRIEFDLRRTRDGHLVVIHDAKVDRTTDGEGLVCDMDLVALQKLRSGVEQIPTFAETIDCMDGRSRMLVELKDEDIAEQAVRQIEAAGVVDQCTLSTFHEPSLRQVHDLNPDIEIAWFHVTPGPLNAAGIVKQYGAGVVIVWPAAADREQIAEARECGLQVRCGFRDDLSFDEIYTQLCEFAELGVTEFSSGRPDWIGRMIATHLPRG